MQINIACKCILLSYTKCHSVGKKTFENKNKEILITENK